MFAVHVLLVQQLWQPLDYVHTGQRSQQASIHQAHIRQANTVYLITHQAETQQAGTW